MTQKQIHRRNLIAGTLTVLICGVLYYCFVKMTGTGIPCFFHLITGLKCPGCGISTMLMTLIEGDFQAAFTANPFLLVTLPLLLFELGFSFWLEWNEERQPKWNNILLIIYIVLLVLFGILRNIPDIRDFIR